MKLLAIETSCDDASVAIVTDERDTRPEHRRRAHPLGSVRILAERTASQVELGKKYGGVFPELAAREHFATLLPTIEETLRAYNPVQDPRETLKSLGAIAVTAGPGLIGSLLVGVTVAQALAMGLGKKLIPVNHLAGHIFSVFLEDAEDMQNSGNRIRNSGKGLRVSLNSEFSDLNSVPEFPALALTVSGGHTHLVWMERLGDFKVLGQTRDDAAGEAFDKVSVMLGLGYPGGPAIERAARLWNPGVGIQNLGQHRNTNLNSEISDLNSVRLAQPHFPRPMIDEGLEFSFSGLKTSVRYWLDKQAVASQAVILSSAKDLGDASPPVADQHDNPLNPAIVGAAAYEVQEAITDVLVTKLLRAAEQRNPKSLILAGGVAANTRLREKLLDRIAVHHSPFTVHLSSKAHSTDNGAMIGAAALAMLATGVKPVDPAQVEARSSWSLAT